MEKEEYKNKGQVHPIVRQARPRQATGVDHRDAERPSDTAAPSTALVHMQTRPEKKRTLDGRIKSRQPPDQGIDGLRQTLRLASSNTHASDAKLEMEADILLRRVAALTMQSSGLRNDATVDNDTKSASRQAGKESGVSEGQEGYTSRWKDSVLR
jgi:hypothetical protein